MTRNLKYCTTNNVNIYAKALDLDIAFNDISELEVHALASIHVSVLERDESGKPKRVIVDEFDNNHYNPKCVNYIAEWIPEHSYHDWVTSKELARKSIVNVPAPYKRTITDGCPNVLSGCSKSYILEV